MICSLKTLTLSLVTLLLTVQAQPAFLTNLLKEMQERKKSTQSVKSEKPIIAWDSSDKSQPAANAGIITTLSQKFFDECNELSMSIFQNSITRLQIQDYCTE